MKIKDSKSARRTNIKLPNPVTYRMSDGSRKYVSIEGLEKVFANAIYFYVNDMDIQKFVEYVRKDCGFNDDQKMKIINILTSGNIKPEELGTDVVPFMQFYLKQTKQHSGKIRLLNK